MHERNVGGSGAGAYVYGRKEHESTPTYAGGSGVPQQQQYQGGGYQGGGQQGFDPRYGNQQLPPQQPNYLAKEELRAGYEKAQREGYGNQYLQRYQDDIEKAGGFWKPNQQQQTYAMGGQGVTGAKGGGGRSAPGGGWIGQGDPNFIAMMHSLPPGHPVRTQFEQAMGQKLQSITGSFSGPGQGGYDSNRFASAADAKMGNMMSAGQQLDNKIRGFQQQLAADPHMSAGQRQRINQNIQDYSASYQQSVGRPYPGQGGGGGGGSRAGISQQYSPTHAAANQARGAGFQGYAPGTFNLRGGGGGGGAGLQGTLEGQLQQQMRDPSGLDTTAARAEESDIIGQGVGRRAEQIRQQYAQRGQSGTQGEAAALRQAEEQGQRDMTGMRRGIRADQARLQQQGRGQAMTTTANWLRGEKTLGQQQQAQQLGTFMSAYGL